MAYGQTGGYGDVNGQAASVLGRKGMAPSAQTPYVKGQVIQPWQRQSSAGVVGNGAKGFVANNVASTMQTPILSTNSVGASNPSPIGGAPPAGSYGASSYGASGGTASGGFDPQSLMNQYNTQYNAATQANTDRYNQGVQGYSDLYDRGMNNIAQTSGQNAADIRQQGENSKAANNQKMMDSGLGGTTVGSTLNTGVDAQTAANLNRNNDQMLQTKNATDNQLTGNKLGFIERRNDPYPDLGQYSQMMMQMGQTGFGASGGYGAGAGGGGGGAPAQGNYGNPNGAGGQGFGSVINGDVGTKQNIYTRQAGADGNGLSVVQRTPLEEQLARNPFFLDSMNPGAVNTGPAATNSRYGAAPLTNYQNPQLMNQNYGSR